MSPLKLAIIGCGKVAVKHIKAALYHHKSIELAALVDTRPEAARQAMKAAGLNPQKASKVAVFSETAAMLEQASPDLVAITTPSSSHFALAKRSIEHGCHVICEKPMTLSLAEADELSRLAEQFRVVLAVGHIYRYFPVVQQLETDLRSGVFGKILYGDVKVRWGHDQAYYDQGDWRGTWEHDGGALMNQSIHALDLMIWLLGGRVVEACGRLEQYSHQMEAEDFALATLKLDNGACCQVEGTTCTPPDRQEASFYILGSGGEIRCGIRSGRPRIEVLDKDGKKVGGQYLRKDLKRRFKHGGIQAIIQLKNPHSGLYGDVIQAIQNKKKPLADDRSGRDAVEMVLAVYQSAKSKLPVKLPLQDFSLADMTGYFK